MCSSDLLNEHRQPCPVLPEAWRFFWQHGRWNEIRARIEGDPPTITTWVNGVRILTFTEPVSQHPARGKIGLQVHGGEAGAGFVVPEEEGKYAFEFSKGGGAPVFEGGEDDFGVGAGAVGAGELAAKIGRIPAAPPLRFLEIGRDIPVVK